MHNQTHLTHLSVPLEHFCQFFLIIWNNHVNLNPAFPVSKTGFLLHFPCRKEFEVTPSGVLFSLLITPNPLWTSLQAKQSTHNCDLGHDTVSTHRTKKNRKDLPAKQCLKIKPCYLQEQCKQVVISRKGKEIPPHRGQCQHRKSGGVCNSSSAEIPELAECPAGKAERAVPSLCGNKESKCKRTQCDGRELGCSHSPCAVHS